MMLLSSLSIKPIPISDDRDGDGWTNDFEVEMGTNPDYPLDTFACNGAVSLCQKQLTEVTFAETHNAHSSMDWGFLGYAANHELNLTGQMEAGFRGLMLDTHYPEEGGNEVLLCHGSYGESFQGVHPCSFGSHPLIDALELIRKFLENNTEEVFILSFENYVLDSELITTFNDAGMAPHMYWHDGEDWPTLGEMVRTGQRVVAFSDTVDGQHDFLLRHRLHVRGTPWGAPSVEELSCTPIHGSSNAELYRLTTYLTYSIGLSYPHGATITNQPEFIHNHTIDCWVETGVRPNLVSVDWWEQGDVPSAVLRLNQIEYPEIID